MPAPSSWLRRAASRRVFLRALLGLAAFAGMTATHAGAPGAATLDDGQRHFSKAETLVWQTDHLANVRRPSRLRYRYTKTGTAEEQQTDVIDLEVLRVHPYAHTTYAFTFAEGVPGQLYEIRSVVPQPDGAPLIEEVLTFIESRDR